MEPIRVDVSGMKLWRDCQLAHYLSYVRKLQPKGSSNPKSPLIYGSIGHDGLEGWYTPSTYHDDQASVLASTKSWARYRATDERAEENKLEWGTLLAGVTGNLVNYHKFYREEDVHPLNPEQPFELELTSDVSLYGKIDSFIEYKGSNDLDYKIWILEHKFYKTIPNDLTYLNWDFQTSVYSFVGRALFGERFGGVLYNFIRKVVPKDPENPQFLRQEITRPKELLKSIAKFVVVQARQMNMVYERGPIWLVPKLDSSPMYNNTCKGCMFNRDACKAFREGGDWEGILENNYMARPEYANHEEADL